mmetsp:Transcript_24770/g.71490  ORF Transcript_24770/g.71490 Transcript_24770/m.71490 type:complete len:248 (-) Transcript_24770:174-917(-)
MATAGILVMQRGGEGLLSYALGTGHRHLLISPYPHGQQTLRTRTLTLTSIPTTSRGSSSSRSCGHAILASVGLLWLALWLGRPHPADGESLWREVEDLAGCDVLVAAGEGQDGLLGVGRTGDLGHLHFEQDLSPLVSGAVWEGQSACLAARSEAVLEVGVEGLDRRIVRLSGFEIERDVLKCDELCGPEGSGKRLAHHGRRFDVCERCVAELGIPAQRHRIVIGAKAERIYTTSIGYEAGLHQLASG